MEKKYKLTEETINVNGKTLYRIKSLKDFGNVKKGDKGGFIENESNLSQSGDCWVYCDAKVFEDARIYGNARVLDNAVVRDNAKVYGNAAIYCDAKVYDNAKICDYAEVYGYARVRGNAKVCDNAMVYDNAKVYGNANVYGHAMVYDNANVYGHARIYGNAEILAKAVVCGDAVITNKSDYILFKNWWSSGRCFTWTRSNNMWKVGCFYGTSNELIEKAYKDSKLSGREYERVVKYVEAILNNNTDV